jgi:hypothetical protein
MSIWDNPQVYEYSFSESKDAALFSNLFPLLDKILLIDTQHIDPEVTDSRNFGEKWK